MLTLLRCMVCSSVLLLIHGPIVMFVLGGVTGLVLANSETDLVMPAAPSWEHHHGSTQYSHNSSTGVVTPALTSSAGISYSRGFLGF